MARNKPPAVADDRCTASNAPADHAADLEASSSANPLAAVAPAQPLTADADPPAGNPDQTAAVSGASPEPASKRQPWPVEELHRPLLIIEDEEGEADSAPVEDPTPQVLDELTYATAAVHVYGLETAWDKYDPLQEPNRPLDVDHARRIAEDMKANLKLADAAHRLCIMMSAKEFEICVQHTAIYNLYRGKFSVYNKESAQPGVRERVAFINQLDRPEVVGNAPRIDPFNRLYDAAMQNRRQTEEAAT